MEPRFGEVSRGLAAPFPLDEVLTSHALGGEASAQSPWMYRELVGDGVSAALAGGQQATSQRSHAFR